MFRYFSVVIPDTAQTSVVVDLDGATLCGVIHPSAAAGTISLKIRHPLTGAAVVWADLTFAANEYESLADDVTRGVEQLFVTSSSAQTADRTWVLVAKEKGE